MTANDGVNFVQAYLPYSYLGRISLDFLMDGHGWTRDQAVDYIRTHPGVVDKRF